MAGGSCLRKDGGARGRRPRLVRALVALTLAAPLPFGAVAGWASAIVAVASGALLLAWGVGALAGRTVVPRPSRFVWWSVLAFALAVLWAVLQTVGFTPEPWHHELWRDTAEALGTPYHGAVSLDPATSREGIVRIVACAGAFWLALQYGRDRWRAWYALQALAVGSTCYALYGLAVTLSGARVILWFEKTANVDAVTATFVNQNSFATYAGIGLLCTTAVLRRRFVGGLEGIAGVRERLRLLLGELVPRYWLFLACWLALASALLLSLSRGGVAATAVALLAFLWVLPASRGVRARTLLLRTVGPVLVGAALLLLGGEGMERRLWEAGPDWEKRLEIYSQTVKAIEDAPLLGTGLGTYASVYRSYRTEDVRPGVHMAHNDYLELALELGIPAAAVLVLSVVMLALVCVRGVRVRRADIEIPAAGVAVCTLVGIHALVDFSLQIPAVAITFALVLGVAVAQSRRSDRSPRRADAAT